MASIRIRTSFVAANLIAFLVIPPIICKPACSAELPRKTAPEKAIDLVRAEVKAPIIVGQPYVFMQGEIKFPRGAYAGKDGQRVEIEFAEGIIAWCCDRFRGTSGENEHASRHVARRGDKQVTLPTFKSEQLFNFYGTFESVARFVFSDDVVLRYAPLDQIIACNFISVSVGSEQVNMPAGNDDGLGLKPIETPGFLQAMEHRFINGRKRNQTGGGNHAAGEYDDGVVGTRFSRIK